MLSLPKSRPIRPDDFALLAQIPEISAVARDEETRMFWCTELFVQWARQMRPADFMIGSSLCDALPPLAARERADIQLRVMETGEINHHYQLSRDRRMLVTVFPLDEKAFGHRGILGVVKESPHSLQSPFPIEIPVMSTPNLFRLDALSLRELEVLHYIAQGLATRDIAASLSRANKTIEHHINSIHSKLETHSRAQLVRWLSERGIQSFSDNEWTQIVEGARQLRKSRVGD